MCFVSVLHLHPPMMLLKPCLIYRCFNYVISQIEEGENCDGRESVFIFLFSLRQCFSELTLFSRSNFVFVFFLDSRREVLSDLPVLCQRRG